VAEWFCSSVKYAVVTPWAGSTAYGVGDLRRQLATPANQNKRVFRCTTAGTSGASEPAWNLAAGATTTDGSCVWTEVTANAAYGWNTAAYGLDLAAARAAGGDTIWVANNHDEQWTASFTVAFTTANAGVFAVSVDNTVTSPTIADKSPGAIVQTTGAGSDRHLTISGYAQIYGINFRCSANNNSQVRIGTTAASHRLLLDTCPIRAHHALQAGVVGGGASSRQSTVEFVNCTLEFTRAQDGFQPQGNVIWRDTPAMLVSPSYKPPLAYWYYTQFATVEFRNCDLSTYAAGDTIFVTNAGADTELSLVNCKLGASVSIASTATGTLSNYPTVNVINCDSGGTVYRNERRSNRGSLLTETTLIRSGGASNGATGFSWLFNPKSANTIQSPFQSFPLSVWNEFSGTTRTMTLYGVANGAAIATNKEVWLEVNYLGSSASPLATCKSSAPSHPLETAINLTADSSAWDSLVPARANSAAVALGALRKVASNTGRVFACITAGTTAAAEPAGYASASDGASVTDGSAVFRALWRWRIEVPLASPNLAMAGPVTARVCLASADTTRFFAVDPAPLLS